MIVGDPASRRVSYKESLRLAFTILILTAITAHADAKVRKKLDSLELMLDEFKESRDIGGFCSDFKKNFPTKCRSDINEDDVESFTQAIEKGTRKDVVTFINVHIVEHDPDLEMSVEECAEFYANAESARATEFLEMLTNAIASRNREFVPATKKSSVIRQRMHTIQELETCNLEPLAAIFGRLKPAKLSPSRLVNQFKGFFSTPALSNELEKLEKDILIEQKELAELTKAVYNRRSHIATLIKECLINRIEAKCGELTKAQDTLILEQLGTVITKNVLMVPALRDVAYSVATIVEEMRLVSIRGIVRNLGSVLAFMANNMSAVFLILFVLFMWFRPDIGNIVAVCFAMTGLGVVPLLKLIRVMSTGVYNRGRGLALTLAIVFAVYGLNTIILTPIQAASTVYVCIAAYALITDKEPSIIRALGVVSPLIAYVFYVSPLEVPNLITEVISTTSRTRWDFDVFSSWMTPRTGILPALAFAFCLAVFNLCALCDGFGYSTYSDTYNAKSGKSRVNDFKPDRPTLSTYLAAGFNWNSFIVLSCAMIPGMFSQAVWFWIISIYATAVALSGLIYLGLYHDAFRKEGETAGAASDKILESMNIIIGMAPKNVILPQFQMHAGMALCCAAFCMGFNASGFPTAVLFAALMAAATCRSPARIVNYLGWACGAIIMFSGSIAHAVIGIAYLALKVQTKIKFDLSAMGKGLTMNEVEL